jgi:ABC-type phosphate transport system ATPase subunit
LQVLFLDEPTASIDQANTEIIEEIIMKMKAEKKVTIIMVTHNPAQAERPGDRLLFMKEGRLLPG